MVPVIRMTADVHAAVGHFLYDDDVAECGSVTSLDEDDVTGVKAFLLHNTLLNFLARPQFIAYRIGPRPPLVHFCEAMGAMKFCWTSHEPRNERGQDGVIFEFYRPKLKFK